MKKSTKILSILLVLFLLIQTMALGAFAVTPYTEDTPLYAETRASYVANWGEREEVCENLSAYAINFYTGSYTFDNLKELDGGGASDAYTSELYKSLQTLMKSNHSYVTSYNATRDLFKYTDCVNGNTSKISSFYSGTMISGSWDGGSTWNREHCWPNSKGDLAGNGENDIMMLRPTSVSENSSRGNKAYGESSGYYNPNSVSNGKYDLRGDCARIVLYQYVRWGAINTGSQYNSKDIYGTNGVIESLTILLKWMAQDPVDTWEMGRNDAVQSITGTRNVFVDYPELAWLLFGQDVPSDITTPSGEASGNLTGSGNTGSGNGSGSGSTDTPTLTTPEEILEAAYDLNPGETLGQYTLTGVITELDKYNNPTIVVDGLDDMPIYCYYLKDDRFVVGATITVTGTIKNYQGTVEFDYCTLNSFTAPSNPGTDDPSTDGPGNEQLKDAFLTEYNAISSCKGEAKYNHICQALTYYSMLTDSEKEELAAEYSVILSTANSYNTDADALNAEMDSINEIILSCATTMAVLCAAAYVIGKKIF